MIVGNNNNNNNNNDLKVSYIARILLKLIITQHCRLHIIIVELLQLLDSKSSYLSFSFSEDTQVESSGKRTEAPVTSSLN